MLTIVTYIRARTISSTLCDMMKKNGRKGVGNTRPETGLLHDIRYTQYHFIQPS